MSRISYVNGRYLPHGSAAVHIEDRGYQFADGVYEVFAVAGGRLLGEEGHWRRLLRSLGELRIEPPMGTRAMKVIVREIARRNRVCDGIVYLQITRGVAPRDHPFPDGVKGALVVTARRKPAIDPARLAHGVGVISIPDERWKRCDIKSVSLLPNILGKQRAREQGAYEAWMIDGDGMVTEGTSSNAWIVTHEGEIVTRQADEGILNGITRLTVMGQADAGKLTVIQRPFSLDEAKRAKEAFLTSSSSHVTAVTSIDGQPVGNGAVGEVTERLIALYMAEVEAGSGLPRGAGGALGG